jgi:hypothetical protein
MGICRYTGWCVESRHNPILNFGWFYPVILVLGKVPVNRPAKAGVIHLHGMGCAEVGGMRERGALGRIEGTGLT